jgi:FkbM family methyltransferase
MVLTGSRSSPKVQALVRAFSGLTRLLPSDNKLLRGFLLNGSTVFDRYCFDFTFHCWRIGVRWSAQAFPEQFTRHMIFDGLYQPDVLYWIRRLSRPGDTIFDVGAFHGLMTVVASKAVKERGRVISFEPNQKSRAHLSAHLELNKCGNVTIEPIGLMDAERDFEFYPQAGNSSWNSSFVREFVDPSAELQPEKIHCATLDSYVETRRVVPRLIKIDTEGTEFKVLKGGLAVLRQYRPIVLMEFNPKSAEKAGTTVAEILKLLEDLNYQMLVVPAKPYGGYDFRVHVRFSEDVPTLEGLANVACVPQERVADLRL